VASLGVLAKRSNLLHKFQLARKYHPDTNKDPAAKDKFLDIQSAYEVSLGAYGDLGYSGTPASLCRTDTR
jgi:hypothetical protein